MNIIKEFIYTFDSGLGALLSMIVALVAFALLAGIFLIIPVWLVMEMKYYIIGMVYIILVYGAAWRLTE